MARAEQNGRGRDAGDAEAGRAVAVSVRGRGGCARRARAVGGALQDRTDSGGPRVAFACGVWSDLACPLKPGFLKAVAGGGYRAEASTVDFRGDPDGSRQLINTWAARATNSLIDSVLGPGSVTESTRVVLGNAVYFKGK